MPEMTNRERASLAADAVTAYAASSKRMELVPAEILGDLLCDLRHFADRHNVDFDQCAKNAKACYLEEKGEERNA